MSKKLSLWIGLLLVGYVIGARGAPAAEEFLIYSLAYGVAGFWLGKRYVIIRDRVKAAPIRLLGFEIRRGVTALPEVAAAVETSSWETTCELCGGEPIRIAGTKETMACPKCKTKRA